MDKQTLTYKNHRLPSSIVARAIRLYFRFNLSLRDVEEMMLERGVVVSYETIRRWCRSHGSLLTARLRRKTLSANDVWHLDEVAVRISGRKCWLLRAVDHQLKLLGSKTSLRPIQRTQFEVGRIQIFFIDASSINYIMRYVIT